MNILDITKGLRAFDCSEKDHFFLTVAINIWLKSQSKITKDLKYTSQIDFFFFFFPDRFILLKVSLTGL